jgi:hypothetical protein
MHPFGRQAVGRAPTPAAARAREQDGWAATPYFVIRTEDEMHRNIGESQSLMNLSVLIMRCCAYEAQLICRFLALNLECFCRRRRVKA